MAIDRNTTVGRLIATVVKIARIDTSSASRQRRKIYHSPNSKFRQISHPERYKGQQQNTGTFCDDFQFLRESQPRLQKGESSLFNHAILTEKSRISKEIFHDAHYSIAYRPTPNLTLREKITAREFYPHQAIRIIRDTFPSGNHSFS